MHRICTADYWVRVPPAPRILEIHVSTTLYLKKHKYTESSVYVGLPERLGAGLQNQLERFDSVTLLYFEFNKKKPYSNTSMPCKP